MTGNANEAFGIIGIKDIEHGFFYFLNMNAISLIKTNECKYF